MDSEETLRYEIINHSQDEMVNQNIFNTNTIEFKYLLLRNGFGQGYQIFFHDIMIVKNGVYLSINIKHVRY